VSNPLQQFWYARETWLFFWTYLWWVALLFVIYCSQSWVISPLWVGMRAIPIISWFATGLVGILFFLSTLVHEIGHTVVGLLTGAHIDEIVLCPTTKRNEAGEVVGIELGHVNMRADRQLIGLISLGPIFLGSVLLFATFQLGFKDIRVPSAFQDLGDYFEYIGHCFEVMLKKPYLFYLVYSFGNGALPSKPDWEAWGVYTFFWLTVLMGITYFFIYFLVGDLSSLYWWLHKLTTLVLAFALAVILNLILFIPVQFFYQILEPQPH